MLDSNHILILSYHNAISLSKEISRKDFFKKVLHLQTECDILLWRLGGLCPNDNHYTRLAIARTVPQPMAVSVQVDPSGGKNYGGVKHGRYSNEAVA